MAQCKDCENKHASFEHWVFEEKPKDNKTHFGVVCKLKHTEWPWATNCLDYIKKEIKK